MKNQRNILLILTFFCLNISAISKISQDSIILKQNTDTSILKVNFDYLNSINIESLEFQANLLFLQKDFEKATKLYLDIIEHNIDDAKSFYQLACCFAMLDKPDYAANFLILAINKGYNDYSKIKKEECFNLIMSNNEFKQALKKVLNYGKNYGETVYVNANVFIKCRVILPDNFDPNKEYSLLTGLHGFGGLAENFCQIQEDINSDNFIFVVPEAPYFSSDSYNKKQQYSWGLRVNRKELWEKSDPEVMKYIMNVVNQMNEKYNIDKNYLLGFSQGASYAYAIGIKNSNKIDAIFTFGGRLPDTERYPWFLSDEDLVKGKNLKVFIAHGKGDEAISYKKSIEAKKKLSKLDYEVELFLFEGGHLVHEEAINKALDWIDATNK